MQSHVAIATGHAAVNKRLEFYAVPFSVSLSLSLPLSCRRRRAKLPADQPSGFLMFSASS